MKRLLCIGECMVELSDAGHGLLRRGFAGDTFNTAWYARKLLPADWQVSYLSAVGDDAISAEMLAFMASSGVDTTHVPQIAGASPGLYMISLREGERSFSYWRDSSAARQLARDKACVAAAMAGADVIYFSGITLAILPPDEARALVEEAERARDRGVLVAFDTNYRPRLWRDRRDARELMLAASRCADIVLPGLDDEQALRGPCDADAVAQRYLSGNTRLVVVKDGSNGATVFEAGQRTHVPAVTAREVVDTSAAGDSFSAAFLARLAQGDEAVTAARFASAIAAQVVSARGALVEIATPSSG